jgi:acyl-CoA thioester hydrolase
METFIWPIRVYYEDTDSGGVVYHSNYLNFMERGRTEWLRTLGYQQDVLREQEEILFAVHSMDLKFRQPARFNDTLQVESTLTQLAGASMTFEQKIVRDKELLCDAKVRIACLDCHTFKPKQIPMKIRLEMQSER